jgi:hypothetical protein
LRVTGLFAFGRFSVAARVRGSLQHAVLCCNPTLALTFLMRGTPKRNTCKALAFVRNSIKTEPSAWKLCDSESYGVDHWRDGFERRGRGAFIGRVSS